MSLLKRLNKGVDSEYFSCSKDVVDVITVSCVVRQEQKLTVKEVESGKEPDLVLEAVLEDIEKGHEFVDGGESQYLVY